MNQEPTTEQLARLYTIVEAVAKLKLGVHGYCSYQLSGLRSLARETLAAHPVAPAPSADAEERR